MATHNGIPDETLAALRAAYTPGAATVVFAGGAGWQSGSWQGDARVIALLDAYEALRATADLDVCAECGKWQGIPLTRMCACRRWHIHIPLEALLLDEDHDELREGRNDG